MALRGDGTLTEAHWASLRYFTAYRALLAAILFVAVVLLPETLLLLPPTGSSLYVPVATLYLVATSGVLLLSRRVRLAFDLQLTLHVLVDIVVFVLLANAAGGAKNGLGAMLLISLASAGLVGQGRMVLFYAASAALGLLGEELWRGVAGGGLDMTALFQTGVLCGGFFATAITARLLARRILANEELARRRGIALRDQMLVSQRVIEDMQDGVLVVAQDGTIRQRNPRAEAMLGLRAGAEVTLRTLAPALDQDFRLWQAGGGTETAPFQAEAGGMLLRARFVPTGSSAADVLVFLEDVGRLQAQAQQLKLAALGRLTASIAHEIRNPLSAISHAGELLVEEGGDGLHARLARIVLDNAQRLERIVRDVLELGRRDRAHPELIELAPLLAAFVDELTVKEGIDPALVSIDAGAVAIRFDRFQLHQVLANLVGNALRHCSRGAGSVRLRAQRGRAAQEVELHVIDDGPGVPPELGEQVFEPFFTTHARGTGLGLYIARELCEANGARLELLDNAPGAHFRITGRIEACQPHEQKNGDAAS